jgi:Rap1a immunity proteins
MKRCVIAAVCICTAAVSSPAGAAEVQNFYVRDAGDLVTLCMTDPDDDNYIAAIHFCQGFAVGAYQYYKELVRSSPDLGFVCLPNPPPSRNDTMTAFTEWANAHPQYLKDPAVDTMFRYLGETYPCKK